LEIEARVVRSAGSVAAIPARERNVAGAQPDPVDARVAHGTEEEPAQRAAVLADAARSRRLEEADEGAVDGVLAGRPVPHEPPGIPQGGRRVPVEDDSERGPVARRHAFEQVLVALGPVRDSSRRLHGSARTTVGTAPSFEIAES